METNHDTVIYPHPYQIVRMTPWSPDPEGKSKGVAGVYLRYGPISFSAKLVLGDKGMFLGMPSRKNETSGEYYNQVTITDRTLLETFQNMAIAEYHRVTGLVPEVVAA